MDKTILLVTKTDLLQFRMESLLNKINHELIITHSKIDAIHKLNYFNNDFDLFILDLDDDIEMFSLIDEINNRQINKPIILLSSFNDKNTFLKAIKLGIDDFIIKPFDDERMTSTLNKYLREKVVEVRNEVRNYQKDLSLEIKKANKGAYPVTFIIFNFVGKNKLYFANTFMRKLLNEKWDTDKAIFYTKDVIIGIFLFSGQKNLKVIEEKMKYYYSVINENKNASEGTDMIMQSLIYPTQVGDYDDFIYEINKFLRNKNEVN